MDWWTRGLVGGYPGCWTTAPLEQSTRRCPVCLVTGNISLRTGITFIMSNNTRTFYSAVLQLPYWTLMFFAQATMNSFDVMLWYNRGPAKSSAILVQCSDVKPWRHRRWNYMTPKGMVDWGGWRWILLDVTGNRRKKAKLIWKSVFKRRSPISF